MLRQYALHVYINWAKQCEDTFLSMLERNPHAVVLDLGAGDGKFTMIAARKIASKNIHAIEGLKINIKGIKTKNSNLNKKFPYASNSFDVVISNYSIEHLYNTPMFVAETHRVLKKGGYTVVATDNLASWPNVLSLMLGFQAFSTAFMVKGQTVGNPFALRSEGALTKGPAPDPNFASQWRHSEEFGHNKVLAYRGLIDTYKAFKFKVEQVRGVGYFPFFSYLSKFFSNLDPRHSHLIIMKARKI